MDTPLDARQQQQQDHPPERGCCSGNIFNDIIDPGQARPSPVEIAPAPLTARLPRRAGDAVAHPGGAVGFLACTSTDGDMPSS